MSRTTAFFLAFASVFALAAGLGLDAQAPAPAPAPASEGSFVFSAPAGGKTLPPAVPPLELTTSEGVGLRLAALDARAVLEPPLAFTELRLAFDNPEDRQLEGRFRITLPTGAAISRFAMKIGDSWQEGEVVERQRARRIYEDFLHRRQDPALLEQEAGNEFAARVFPIPAQARKEIVISYSYELPRETQDFAIPLLGLPEIGRLDVTVLLGERPAGAPGAAASSLGGELSERRMVSLSRQDWKPDRDFTVAQEALGRRAGLRHGNLVVARVTPAISAEPQKIRGLYLLVDSSASRALGYGRNAELAAELLRGLRRGSGGAAPIGLAAFDQEVAPLFEGASSSLSERDLAALEARRPLGASDLEGALRWLAGRLERQPGQYPRVLIATDGIATAGATDPAALKAAAQALGAAGVERIDVLATGALRDDALLRELVQGNLRHDGAVIEADAGLDEIARRLTLACRAKIAVTVPGAAWVWPESLAGVQPGDAALVYADLPEGKDLEIRLDGKKATLAGGLAPAERPLLERQWVAARIARLEHLRAAGNAGDEDLRRALALQITELSIKHRVLSPLTAFLVLETAADYERYGLDRRALADILTVGAGGLEVLARTPPPTAPVPLQPRKTAAAERLEAAARSEETATETAAGSEDDGVANGAPADRDEARLEPIEAGDAPDGVSGGAPGDVVSGIAGGVAGSVPGGAPGGAPGGTVAGPAVVPLEVPPPPPPPPPAPRPARAPAEPPAIAEELVVENGERRERRSEGREALAGLKDAEPYEGRFAEVMAALAAGQVKAARAAAEAWRAAAPGDLLALIALGEAAEAGGDKTTAARAYGSLIDLYPGRADLRRYAGERLERLGEEALDLVVDTYAKAAADRPDHPSGHRLLAWALARRHRFAEAVAALEKGLDQDYPEDRFAEVQRVIKEDLGLIAAAWLREEPRRREDLRQSLAARGALVATRPSLRFVLSWETDANDVDLHVFDRAGGHAYYQAKELPSGGELYADVTTGYGPECFKVENPAQRQAGPYRLAAHYYSRGPMGFGMGILHIIATDGKGSLSIEPRPFVVMKEQQMVDLGEAPVPKGL